MQIQASALDSAQTDWLMQQQPAMVEQLCAWSNINSGSYHLAGLARQRQVLIDAFTVLQAPLDVLPAQSFAYLDDTGQHNRFTPGDCLHWQMRPEAPLQILLTGHMDTVFGADHPFQIVQQQGNYLRGPGVADMKGGLLVMLYALQVLERSPASQALGWRVLINSDEEIGSHGSRQYLQQFAKQAAFGFIFEPAMDEHGTLVGQRKGSGNFTVVARGVSAHVGRAFETGRNAIVGLTHVIQALHALNGQRASVTVNVGVVTGGTANNAVPDTAVARVDVRVQTDEDQAWFEAEVARILAMPTEAGVAIDIEGAFTRPPRVLDSRAEQLFHWVVQEAGRLNMPLQVKPSGGCSDGNNLAAAGLPNVDTLGVYGGHIHSDQEYMLIDSLFKRTLLTAHLLLMLAQGKGPER